jgi:hypothetical protein
VPEELCIATSSDLVIDGANGVCADARHGAGEPLSAFTVAPLAALVLIAALLFSPKVARTYRAAGLGVLLALAALPGGYAVLFERADRPSAVADSTAPIAALHEAIRDFATASRGPCVVESACLACDPIARLALIDRGCAPGSEVVLHADALRAGCQVEGTLLRCGHRDAEDGSREERSP